MQLSILHIMGKNIFFASGEIFQLPRPEKFIRCFFRAVLEVCFSFLGTQTLMLVPFRARN